MIKLSNSPTVPSLPRQFLKCKPSYLCPSSWATATYFPHILSAETAHLMFLWQAPPTYANPKGLIGECLQREKGKDELI